MSQEDSTLDLVLDDPEDLKLLEEEFPEEEDILVEDDGGDIDDLESLRDDLGDVEFTLPDEDNDLVKQICSTYLFNDFV